MLLDGDRLVLSFNGCVYCLGALSGETRWQNALKGMGIGLATT